MRTLYEGETLAARASLTVSSSLGFHLWVNGDDMGTTPIGTNPEGLLVQQDGSYGLIGLIDAMLPDASEDTIAEAIANVEGEILGHIRAGELCGDWPEFEPITGRPISIYWVVVDNMEF